MLENLKRGFAEVDRLLRGETTRPDRLSATGELQVDVRRLLAIVILLCMLYGMCMGSYSLLKEMPACRDPAGRFLQLAASTIKTPVLFLLTLVVTLPSLYVLNALIGSRLRPAGLCQLLTSALAVNAAVLASLGPIVAFFSLSTSSHPFVLLLNVAMFTAGGVLGLTFLLQTLHRLTGGDERRSMRRGPVAQLAAGAPVVAAPVVADAATELPSPADAAEGPPVFEVVREPSPLDMPEGETLARHTQLVFRCWVVLFALVGAQMGWVMRPFVGSPDLPFTWFRERQSNFFTAVLHALGALLLGEG